MVGISTDSIATQKKFKEELKLPYPLLSDTGGTVAKQYGGTIPVVGLANRVTYVVGQEGRVKEIITGSDAIDPAKSIDACSTGKKG